jgi:hypothetical protein
LYELADELGPVFDIWPMWENVIFTTAPEHIQIILATDFTNYIKGFSNLILNQIKWPTDVLQAINFAVPCNLSSE